MTKYEDVKRRLKRQPKTWLVTGVAGFIGSNLLESLLELNQRVVGLDNLSTGSQRNIDDVQKSVSSSQWSNFTFTLGDIRDPAICRDATQGVDYVLHQAALGSVPRSIEDPISSNASNISGFLNMLDAAKTSRVKSFTYAASSSTYGDHTGLPKKEEIIGRPLSPYAVTKYVNELYSDVYSRSYGFRSIGLRYFNVFGRRQNPEGAYAAVIPKWIDAVINGSEIIINGDGSTTRDFCFIDNAIQANILAATATDEARNEVYNVAVGEQTSLDELLQFIRTHLELKKSSTQNKVIYKDFRLGDVRHSLADIGKARQLLGYSPTHSVRDGLVDTIQWYLDRRC